MHGSSYLTCYLSRRTPYQVNHRVGEFMHGMNEEQQGSFSSPPGIHITFIFFSYTNCKMQKTCAAMVTETGTETDECVVEATARYNLISRLFWRMIPVTQSNPLLTPTPWWTSAWEVIGISEVVRYEEGKLFFFNAKWQIFSNPRKFYGDIRGYIMQFMGFFFKEGMGLRELLRKIRLYHEPGPARDFWIYHCVGQQWPAESERVRYKIPVADDIVDINLPTLVIHFFFIDPSYLVNRNSSPLARGQKLWMKK